MMITLHQVDHKRFKFVDIFFRIQNIIINCTLIIVNYKCVKINLIYTQCHVSKIFND